MFYIAENGTPKCLEGKVAWQSVGDGTHGGGVQKFSPHTIGPKRTRAANESESHLLSAILGHKAGKISWKEFDRSTHASLLPSPHANDYICHKFL